MEETSIEYKHEEIVEFKLEEIPSSEHNKYGTIK